MTLRRRLFGLVTIALLPAVAIQTYNEIDLRRSREAEVRELAVRQAEVAASDLDQIFNGIRNLLTAVAVVGSVRALDTPACVAYLAALQPQVPYLASIAAIGLDGRVACRQTPPRTDLRFDDRSYFKEVVAGRDFVIGEYTEGREVGRPVLPLALPLKDEGGKLVGVVAAALDLGWLNEQLRNRGLAEGGSVTVADRNGVILARDPLPEQFIGTRIPDQFLYLVHAPAPDSIEVTSQDGTRRVLGYVPATPGHDFYISTGLSSERSFAVVTRGTERGIAVNLAALLLALVAAWLAGNWFFRRPIRRLLDAAARWKAGHYESRTGLSGRRGEFGELGVAFDQMAEEIAKRQGESEQANAALRDSEERLRQFNAELEQRVETMLAEREQSAEALRHAQKMQAVGQLAGGVAHDFNNLLTAISGNLRQLRQRGSGEALAVADGIELAVRRGERLARQLLTFSRHEPAHAESVDLRDAVQRVQPLLEKALDANCTIRLKLGADACPAHLDVADLELSLLNLVANARDAMPDGGSIEIAVERVATNAVLSVSDTGTGMTAEVQKRAFEPFFTTKEVGKGTGLGLSGVYGFARQCGGTAEILSQPGQGCTVRLLLPLNGDPIRHARPAHEAPGRPEPSLPAGRTFAGTRVLFVEDDVLVRLVMTDGIEEAGFEVVTAENGDEALSVLEREGATLGAVVTDVSMPGNVNGIEIARRVRQGWPGIALVLTTGYSADAIPHDEMPACFAFLPKPFTVEDLVRKLQTVLASAAADEDASAA